MNKNKIRVIARLHPHSDTDAYEVTLNKKTI